jgi:hypothetical protein
LAPPVETALSEDQAINWSFITVWLTLVPSDLQGMSAALLVMGIAHLVKVL